MSRRGRERGAGGVASWGSRRHLAPRPAPPSPSTETRTAAPSTRRPSRTPCPPQGQQGGERASLAREGLCSTPSSCAAPSRVEAHVPSNQKVKWRDSLGEVAPPSLCHSALEAFQAVRSSPATNNPEPSVFKRCEASILKTLLNLSDLRIFCLL